MANPELKWWRVRWKELGIGFAIVFIATLIASSAYEVVESDLRPWWLAQQYLRSNQTARLVPVELPDKSVAQLAGTRIEVYGDSVQTPWNEQPVIKTGEPATLVSFTKSGASLVIENPDFEHGLIETWRKLPETAEVFREQERSSNYGLMAAAMATTPRELRWWGWPRENKRVRSLLTYKLMSALEPTAIYSISGPAVRGFQFKSKLDPEKMVQLCLFDSIDRQLKIRILSGAGPTPALTQAQINAIVASIRPVEKK